MHICFDFRKQVRLLWCCIRRSGRLPASQSSRRPSGPLGRPRVGRLWRRGHRDGRSDLARKGQRRQTGTARRNRQGQDVLVIRRRPGMHKAQ